MTNNKPPMQPVVLADDGVIRFQQNKVVRFLFDWSSARGMGLNELLMMNFSAEDLGQLAQLIGYSVSGYGDLSYVPQDTIAEADAAAALLQLGELS